MANESTLKAAVVGAGLSGLTAAYRLQQHGWQVTVLEATDRVGGRVQTEELGGYLLDTGATGLAESYESYFALAGDLGIRDQIVPASTHIGIYRDGRLHTLRLDQIARSGLRTRLLSPWAKLRSVRLAVDVARAKLKGRLDYGDMRKAAPLDVESAKEYADRALGAELREYVCEPIVRTMLIADSDDVSVVELFSGVGNIFASRICSLRGGQGRLPRLLADAVGVQLGSPVEFVSDLGDAIEVTWRPLGEASRSERFDACVLACELPVAASICPDRSEILEPLNQAMGYTQCLTVGVGTKVRPHSPALVVQMPPREDAAIALMFLDHNKCDDRAPEGRGLIECCWEARSSQASFDQPDEQIAKRTLEAVLRVFPELRGQVEFTHVTRWAAALPHTQIGAYRLIGDFNARIDPRSRIQFAADYMSAAGQNTAVEFGTRAAGALDRAFGGQALSPPARVTLSG
jgi:protoporphyrinogen/coproporphyrinogen III oxidase